MTETPTMKDIITHMESFLYVNPSVVRNLEACLATILTKRTDLPRLWLMIVGSPSVGKSLILDLFEGVWDTVYMDDASGNALVSGFKEENSDVKKEAKNFSIAKSLDNTILIMSDMTLALTKGEASSSLMNQLRVLFDGRLNKGFGNQEMVEIKASFNMLGGCTHAIDKVQADQSLLGERFLYLKCPDFSLEESFAITQRKLKSSLHFGTYMTELRKLIGKFLDAKEEKDIKGKVPEFTDLQGEKLGRLGMFLAFCRSSPIRDSRGNIIVDGQLEQPARVVQQMLTLASGIAMCYSRRKLSKYDISIAEHAAVSSIQTVRRRFIEVFYRDSVGDSLGFVKKDLEKKFRLREPEVKHIVEDMWHLNMITEESRKGKVDRWYIAPTLLDYINKADVGTAILESKF